jgi:hypothetical protein
MKQVFDRFQISNLCVLLSQGVAASYDFQKSQRTGLLLQYRAALSGHVKNKQNRSASGSTFWRFWADANTLNQMVWISHIGQAESEQTLEKVVASRAEMTIFALERKLFQELTVESQAGFSNNVGAHLQDEVFSKCYFEEAASLRLP